MPAFEDLAGVPPQALRDGFVARVAHGDRLTFAVVEVDPDAELPEHSHENEQLGMVLKGSVTFAIGDETRTLTPGGIWRISANTPHWARGGPEGAVVLDIFAPAREEWKGLTAGEPTPPRWP